MQDKFSFIDSNIALYAYLDQSDDKRQTSRQLIAGQSIISTQVLQEVANILKKKIKADYTVIRSLLKELATNCTKVSVNTPQTVFKACDISERYGFSFYDSLIIAAALENNCEILYSEDLQHHQIIEKSLKIINPFNH